MDRDAILNILNRYQGSFGQKNLDIDIPIIIVLEAQRLSEKYGKDVLGSDDLQKILMIGRCKALELLNDNSFPTLEGLNKSTKTCESILFYNPVFRENTHIAGKRKTSPRLELRVRA